MCSVLQIIVFPFVSFWPLYCLSFSDLRLLITPLVSFDHCIVCPLIYGFWLSLWYLYTFDHCIVCPSLIYGFWLPLWYLLTIVLSVLLWITASDYPFGILDLRLLITLLVSFDHCVVCPSLIYGFWLPLWYLRFTAFDYPFGIFKLFFHIWCDLPPIVNIMLLRNIYVSSLCADCLVVFVLLSPSRYSS